MYVCTYLGSHSRYDLFAHIRARVGPDRLRGKRYTLPLRGTLVANVLDMSPKLEELVQLLAGVLLAFAAQDHAQHGSRVDRQNAGLQVLVDRAFKRVSQLPVLCLTCLRGLVRFSASGEAIF